MEFMMLAKMAQMKEIAQITFVLTAEVLSVIMEFVSTGNLLLNRDFYVRV